MAKTQCPIQANPDTKAFEAEAQIAKTTAVLLSIIVEDVTPKQLLEIIVMNLRRSFWIFGSSIAFEPDSYPWVNGSLKPSFPSLSEGVPSFSGGYNWLGATEPNTLVAREVWPGEQRVLYSPYVSQTGSVVDLADAYNYFAPDAWYHAARTKFINEELDVFEGGDRLVAA